MHNLPEIADQQHQHSSGAAKVNQEVAGTKSPSWFCTLGNDEVAQGNQAIWFSLFSAL
jgi:hypothetical protein